MQLSASQITNLGGRDKWYGMGEVHENEARREPVKVYLLKHKSIREIASSLGALGADILGMIIPKVRHW